MDASRKDFSHQKKIHCIFGLSLIKRTLYKRNEIISRLGTREYVVKISLKKLS